MDELSQIQKKKWLSQRTVYNEQEQGQFKAEIGLSLKFDLNPFEISGIVVMDLYTS